jgi:hypothetical protein
MVLFATRVTAASDRLLRTPIASGGLTWVGQIANRQSGGRQRIEEVEVKRDARNTGCKY